MHTQSAETTRIESSKVSLGFVNSDSSPGRVDPAQPHLMSVSEAARALGVSECAANGI